MLDKKEELGIINPTENLDDIIQVLDKDDSQWIKEHQEVLKSNWKKKQIFRTDTEMRIAVLNDGKHPTQAAKYWQSVREMDSHFTALVSDSFEIRRLGVKKLKLEKKLNQAIERGDELREMELRIDLEENLFHLASMRQVATDRARELKLWTKIQNELDDGSFDTDNVNSHQSTSYLHYWNNRANALNEHSDHADKINVGGSISSIDSLLQPDGKLLDFRELKNNLLSSNNDDEKKLKYLASSKPIEKDTLNQLQDTVSNEDNINEKKVLDFRTK